MSPPTRLLSNLSWTFFLASCRRVSRFLSGEWRWLKTHTWCAERNDKIILYYGTWNIMSYCSKVLLVAVSLNPEIIHVPGTNSPQAIKKLLALSEESDGGSHVGGKVNSREGRAESMGSQDLSSSHSSPSMQSRHEMLISKVMPCLYCSSENQS